MSKCQSCGMGLDNDSVSKFNKNYCVFCQDQESGELKSRQEVRRGSVDAAMKLMNKSKEEAEKMTDQMMPQLERWKEEERKLGGQKDERLFQDDSLLTRLGWQIRIYSLVIIGILVVSDFIPSFLSLETQKVIIMLMALLVFAQSFTPYFARNRRLAKWVMIILVVLLLLGIIVFFAAK